MGSPRSTVSKRIYLQAWNLFVQNFPVSIAPKFLSKGGSNGLKSVLVFDLINLSQDGLGRLVEAVAIVPECRHFLS